MLKPNRILAGVLAILFIGFLFTIRDVLEQRVIEVGDSAPKFAVTTESGRNVSRSEFGGKLLLVNFWATWCEPCRDEFPDLIKIDSEYRAQGLDFITVSLDDVSEIKTEVPKFLQQMRATMPAYLLNVSDPEPSIKAVDPSWGGALPATVLYDKNGQIVFKHFGRIKPEQLRAAIEKLVSKPV